MEEYNFKGEYKCFFAVDLGATSGRTILGKLCNGEITTEVLTRFENKIIRNQGHFYWNVLSLYDEILKGLKLAAQSGNVIESIGIDTWGVDIVCIGADGEIIRSPRSYRDPCTFHAMDDFFQTVMDKKSLYMKTGIQVMNFNTVFQLHAMRKENNVAFQNAETILFLPDALSWMLTGEKVCEYSIASTSGMLNPNTRQFDEQLLDAVGVKASQFGRMVMPGEKVGVLSDEIQEITGLGAVPVIAVAGHDTGSAIAAIPATTSKFAYLSSGTWSLMGVELSQPIVNQTTYDINFTNEGGVGGSIRFLKNICGMWLLESCRREWDETVPRDHQKLIEAAKEVEPFRSIIFPDHASFANPSSMINAIKDYCKQTGQPVPETYGQICRCIFDSLALRYKEVFEYLCEMSDTPIEALHIIGGGSLNQYLNQMTADACGVTVLAGPQECTALGNIMVQALAAGQVADLGDMRQTIANSVTPKQFTPANTAVWTEAYNKYKTLLMTHE
ncbi:MAG: rhamnulokinase [Bacteroidaceae bacterium]|nr:rhamnulokinase [Bacteroidaceae bacterium]